MSCGRTDAAVIDALAGRLPRYGLVPFTVMRESVGFLFNRIWHAIRRECLMVVAEGVSTPRRSTASGGSRSAWRWDRSG